MRIEFKRPDDTDEVVGSATWDGRRARIEAEDEQVRAALERIFRSAPVVVDEASYRTLGAVGESVLEPGALEWFRAAAYSRAPAEGLRPRAVPDVAQGAGWDPASNYRTFRNQVGRLEGDRP